MPKKVLQYDLLISCPGDIEDEINVIYSVLDEFNSMYSDVLGITVRAKHWSKNAYAQSGGKPQDLLNNQIVNKCDAAIALLWTRFGTPTDKYGSGTEEEIEIMLSSGKQVFMYFSDKPLSPSKQNPKEYEKVKAFREKYKDKGIYFTYLNDDELRKYLLAHISQFFLSEKRVTEIQEERKPLLVLKSIDEFGKLKEKAIMQKFVPEAESTIEKYLEKIRQIYVDIAALKVGIRKVSGEGVLFAFRKPVEIDSDIKKLISDMASHLNIALEEEFFSLGNLLKDEITGAFTFGGGIKLDGTVEEKRKYRMILSIKEEISKLLEWAPVEKAFLDYNCIKLGLINDGTSIDKDIEITLKISKSSLITIEQFPEFDNQTQGYLLNTCNMYELFGIKSTAEYMDYKTSESPSKVKVGKISNMGLPGYVPDYGEDFVDELRDIFKYSTYLDQDKYIMKLKIDYIKHHTAIAFPSVIFLKDNPKVIEYSISSTNMTKILEGKLEVLDMTK